MTRRRVLVAVSGGIAAYKIPELVRALDRAGFSVRCALTEAAARFVSPLVLQTLTREPVRRDLLDPGEEGQIGHIDLADQAEAVVVAPATANLLARMAVGLADDLVTAVLLATKARILAAPAMNVNMWEHPATQANVATLGARGVRFVGPEVGALACGWEGAGRMAEPDAIVEALELLLGPASLAGERVIVSAGGTREPIDGVRAIVNRSSGKMGFALAAEAARRGAEVLLVAGPSALVTPAGVRRVDVETALELRAAILGELATASVVIMAAAVADFRAAAPVAGKIQKEDLPEGAGLELTLIRNPDILAEICRERGARIVVGFAAESRDVIARAKRKLTRKGCDLLVANDVSRSDAGFDSDQNAVALLTPDGDAEELPLLDKREVAVRIWDRIEKLRGARRA